MLSMGMRAVALQVLKKSFTALGPDEIRTNSPQDI